VWLRGLKQSQQLNVVPRIGRQAVKQAGQSLACGVDNKGGGNVRHPAVSGAAER
jgi:hypothetical protein